MHTVTLTKNKDFILYAIKIIIVALLTGIGAQIKFTLPFTPVPITMQTFFVILGSAYLGKGSYIAQILYLLFGGIGMPLFAGGVSGFLAFFGPTGGYLIGFIMASFFIGNFITKEKSFFEILLIMLLGNLIIYIPGLLQLFLYLHKSFTTTLFLGFYPFIPGDILKLLIAALIYQKSKNHV
jgi:biotin transport system substrate-specific component